MQDQSNCLVLSQLAIISRLLTRENTTQMRLIENEISKKSLWCSACMVTLCGITSEDELTGPIAVKARIHTFYSWCKTSSQQCSFLHLVSYHNNVDQGKLTMTNSEHHSAQCVSFSWGASRCNHSARSVIFRNLKFHVNKQQNHRMIYNRENSSK